MKGEHSPSSPLIHFHFPEPGESRSITGIEGGNEEQDSRRVGGEEYTILPFLIAWLWKLRIRSEPGEGEILNLKVFYETKHEADQLWLQQLGLL